MPQHIRLVRTPRKVARRSSSQYAADEQSRDKKAHGLHKMDESSPFVSYVFAKKEYRIYVREMVQCSRASGRRRRVERQSPSKWCWNAGERGQRLKLRRYPARVCVALEACYSAHVAQVDQEEKQSQDPHEDKQASFSGCKSCAEARTLLLTRDATPEDCRSAALQGKLWLLRLLLGEVGVPVAGLIILGERNEKLPKSWVQTSKYGLKMLLARGALLEIPTKLHSKLLRRVEHDGRSQWYSKALQGMYASSSPQELSSPLMSIIASFLGVDWEDTEATADTSRVAAQAR